MVEEKRSKYIYATIMLMSSYLLFTNFIMFFGMAMGPGFRPETIADHIVIMCRNIMVFSAFLIFISSMGMFILRNWARRLIVALLPLNCMLYICLFPLRGIFNIVAFVTTILPLSFLIYLTRPEVKEIFKKTTIEMGLNYLGIFNLIWSLYAFVDIIDNRYQASSVLLAIFCLISAIGIMKRKEMIRKMFILGIIPLVILTSLNIILFGNKAAPSPIYSDVAGELIPMLFSLVIFPACLNFYILTRSTVKELFK